MMWQVCSLGVKGSFRVTGSLGTGVVSAPTQSTALFVGLEFFLDGTSSVA